MRHQFSFASFALICGLASAGASVQACDTYVVSRPVQTTHVVYRSAPIATYAPVSSIRKPVTVVESAIVTVSRPSVEEVSVVAVQPRTRVHAGSTLNVRALFLGGEKGLVFLKHGAVTQRCDVHSWNAENATFTLPSLDVASEIDASIELVRPNGEVAKQIPVRLAAPVSLVQVQLPIGVEPSSEIFEDAPPAPSAVSFSSASLK